MDSKVFEWINGFAGTWPGLDDVGVFFAEYFLYALAGAVVLMWFSKKFRPKVYLAVFNAFVSRLVLVEAIKRIVDRPRPYETLDVNKLIIDNETGNSFPSGHTVLYFAIAFSFYGTKFFWPLVFLATIGSAARIFVGVHYPADVLFSILVAGAVVLATRHFLRKRETNKG